MEQKVIDINDLASELGVTRQLLNRHILKGFAGDVKKAGEGKTHEMLLTVDNVLTLIRWMISNGRTNRLTLLDAEEKYEQLSNSGGN